MALREDAELAEALRRSEVDAEEALARRVSRCEAVVSSESTGGGGELQRRVDRLEASLGAATEGSLEERIGAIERLIGPEAAEAAEQHLKPLVRVRSMLRALARVSLLPRASDDVARPAPCVIPLPASATSQNGLKSLSVSQHYCLLWWALYYTPLEANCG